MLTHTPQRKGQAAKLRLTVALEQEMADRADKAVELFDDGCNCAQAVIGCCCNEFALDRTLAMRLASGFGGGMATMGLTCGAVTGGFMVIGLAATATGDGPERRQAHKLARQFVQRFQAINGTIVCKDLLGADISTDEGRGQAAEKGLFRSVCPKVVRDAVEILEDLLQFT